ncbi:hypothetical protein DFH07DRAFT_931477 [Mycena maculata]|uniref:Sacsin/Nov domain-containing protein n=1 Tax=Mycena maculata TaxID=230809 RepID=A0AAD7MNW8_9AGAR|nr:hypothetical protein DFH07DRAFT_931477 [Mycena maculata]
MEVIQDIRSQNAAPDSAVWKQADPSTLSALTSLRENLHHACDSLADDLYASDSHFILELVQNADDNTYGPGVTPTLAISLDVDNLIVACNEVGFEERQVRAICKIGASTKKDQQGYIGEKGIGFKSVFKVADKVFISSGPYKFIFDKHAELGMITPSWAENCPSRQDWTKFTLQLSNGTPTQLKLYLDQNINSTLLLFLRKLRCLEIDTGLIKFVVQRMDLEPNVVTLRRGSGPNVSGSSYLLVKRVVETRPGEKKRSNITQTEIVLGFPLQSDGGPKIGQQAVHAFLPIRNYGLYFLIQADFLTSANREDILSGSLWNQSIRNELVSVFMDAMVELRSRPELALVWYRYIPSSQIQHAFFDPFKNSLLDRLRASNILRSADGTLHRPSQLLVVLSKYSDDDGVPLIPERFLSSNFHYLSPEYNLFDQYSTVLRDLGVQDLSDSQFIDGLSRMNLDSAIKEQSASWYEAVCTQLTKLRWSFKNPIKALRIVPLQDGSWTSLGSDKLFFSSEVVDIPRDLGLCLLAKLDDRSSRFSLFAELGVQKADPLAISKKIQDLHDRRPSPAHIITHARFLFAHRDQLGYSNLRLYLLDKNGHLAKATDLYMNSGEAEIMPLSSIISPSHFLNESYLVPPSKSSNHEWHAWLRDTLHVNVMPRVTSGRFSAEFLEFLTNPNSGTGQILRALRDYWPRLKPVVMSAEVKALGDKISVICHDHTFFRLSTTALCRGPLKHFTHLQFIDVEDPDNESWNFLGELGVILRLDGPMYLKWLRRLRQANSDDATAVRSIYKQLEARFNEDDNSSAISDAFRGECLIFVPPQSPSGQGEWISRSNVVWSGGPPSMLSKVDLKRFYPELTTFFRHQLRIPPCPKDILFQELIALISSCDSTGYVISNEVHRRVSHILEDISMIISQNALAKILNPPWISDLALHRIFPVRLAGTKQLKLRSLDEEFYLPDTSGKFFSMFGTRVDMVELEEKFSLRRIRSLLETDHFRRVQSHYLDEAVSCQSACLGDRVPDIEIQEDYLMRANLIQRQGPFYPVLQDLTSTRMLYAEHRLFESEANLLQIKFQNLVVFKAESVVSTYTIEDISDRKEEDLIIEEEPNRLVVLISNNCDSTQYGLQFSKQLAIISGLNKDKLFGIICCPLQLAALYLDQQGIGQRLDVAKAAGDSWAFDMAHNLSVETTEGGWKTIRPSMAPEPAPHYPSDSVKHPTGDSIDMQTTLIALNMQMVSDAARQSVFPVQMVNPNPGEQAIGTVLPQVPDDALVSAHHLGSGSQFFIEASNDEGPTSQTQERPGSGVAPFVRRTQTTPAERANGVLGEYFIYELLRKNLPDFTMDNWTSELRGEIPDFPPHSAGSMADFHYTDEQGVLTRTLFGEDIYKKWADHWPQYYLEVKSTSGQHQTVPFHMSSRQLELVCQASLLTLGAQDLIPTAVYVLVRVWKIRSQAPSFAFSPDPHCKVYTGGLKVISDVEVVLKTL